MIFVATVSVFLLHAFFQSAPLTRSRCPLQDVVNVVGGVGVLLPLLEQICEVEPVLNGAQEISDLLGPELTSSRGPAAMLLPLNKSSGEDGPR